MDPGTLPLLMIESSNHLQKKCDRKSNTYFVPLPIAYRNVTGTSDACVVALPIAYRNGTGTSDACFVAFMCVESV